jgi:hypothetical protein
MAGATSFMTVSKRFPVTMRAAPTTTGITAWTIQGITASASGFSLTNTVEAYYIGGSASNSQADGACRSINATGPSNYTFSAEL